MNFNQKNQNVFLDYNTQIKSNGGILIGKERRDLIYLGLGFDFCSSSLSFVHVYRVVWCCLFVFVLSLCVCVCVCLVSLYLYLVLDGEGRGKVKLVETNEVQIIIWMGWG